MASRTATTTTLTNPWRRRRHRWGEQDSGHTSCPVHPYRDWHPQDDWRMVGGGSRRWAVALPGGRTPSKIRANITDTSIHRLSP